MGEKNASKIDSTLQEFKQDSTKLPDLSISHIQSQSQQSSHSAMNLGELNTDDHYDNSKRRKTLIQEDILFGNEINMNYPISTETISYPPISSASSYYLFLTLMV